MVFLWETIASIRHLKICKHVTLSPQMYVNRICRQPMKWWHPDCSHRAIRTSREFHSHVFLLEVQCSVEIGKTKNKNKRTKKAEPEEIRLVIGRRPFQAWNFLDRLRKTILNNLNNWISAPGWGCSARKVRQGASAYARRAFWHLTH